LRRSQAKAGVADKQIDELCTSEGFPRALADANAVIGVAPDAISYSNRGTIFLMMNQVKSASLDFSAAAKLDPRYAIAWEGLGEVSYDRATIRRLSIT